MMLLAQHLKSMQPKNKFIWLILLVLVLFDAKDLFAANLFEPLANVVCAIATALTSDIAKAMVTVGLVIMGTRAFLGKLDWATVLIVVLGIFLIFGIMPILKAISSAAGFKKPPVAC